MARDTWELLLDLKAFKSEYVSKLLSDWCHEIEALSEVALSQPHATYSAYIHGLAAKWSYVSCTIPDIGPELRPLEDVISQKFIPALTGHPPCLEIERQWLTLPAKMGGLGITVPSSESDFCFEATVKITAPIVALITLQDIDVPTATQLTKSVKSTVNKDKLNRLGRQADNIYDQLSAPQRRLMDCSRERGASSWVTALPINEHGFFLHKGAFRDALCLWYGWKPPNLPLQFACGNPLLVNHAMVCHKGGYPTLRHNEIRDLSADLLKEVCHNTCIEPALQELSGESFQLRSANTEVGAHVNIRASGFWTPAQEAFFDVRGFHPSAPLYWTKDLTTLYKQHKNVKKREYGERIREVERGAFTPLVFTTMGGMAKETTIFFKRLADQLADKQ